MPIFVDDPALEPWTWNGRFVTGTTAEEI